MHDALVEADETLAAAERWVHHNLAAVRTWGPDDVLLVDSTGELKNFYPYATVIFIGKSLSQHGGQNPIEPAVGRFQVKSDE